MEPYSNHNKFPCSASKLGSGRRFMMDLIHTREVWAPVAGSDDSWHLRQIDRLPEAFFFTLPTIPLKKLLLPPDQPVWSWDGSRFRAPAPPPPRVLLGTALCDLQALWYLDRVFSEDPLYLSHRQRLFIIGGPCRPSAHCRCEPAALPVGGDLFLTEDRIWALSEQGESLLAELDVPLPASADAALPSPELAVPARPKIGEDLFRASRADAVWQTSAAGCLACGVCSAVCPTCYCYDMVDRSGPTGDVVRQRQWDNCFFADHGEVAGGQNFRATRGARLRFRFEHKMLGFGPLRGLPSCVGCGRCRAGCPVDIDLDRVVDQLAREEHA